METNKFVYCDDSTEEEIKLTDEVLNGEIINSKNSKQIADRILKLSFVEQLHVLIRIIDLYSSEEIAENKKNIVKFLNQKCFKTHKDIISNLVNDNFKIIEKKYNIKIEINQK